MSLHQSFRKTVVPVIADLRLAIVLLFLIAAFSIFGTIIEQNQSLAFYQANYPEDPALFGFLTWKVLLFIGLDHVYKTWWFLSLLVLFGNSLTACTFTHQFPALNAAQRWKFYQQPRQFQKLALSTSLETNELDTLSAALNQKRYKVHVEGNALYARKGLVGKIGPIIVHVSLILILLSGIIGALAGFMAQEMVPSGENLTVQNIVQAGPLAKNRIPRDWSLNVNRFWIDYTPDGSIDQFYSDLSVINAEGKEVDRQTIHVNKPLSYRGVTFYQTDWSIAALKIRVNKSPVFQIPMAPLKGPGMGEGRIWGTWVPIKPDMSEGVTMLARDLQGSLTVYDTAGNIVSTIRTGMPIEVEGVRLTVDEIVGSTGLQIKSDPGIPFLYLGCGLLIAGVIMSYVSHSQIWALVDHNQVLVGGRTNRAQIGFERELLAIIEVCEPHRTVTDMRPTREPVSS
jgi:cytochrome c biogenesis protein